LLEKTQADLESKDLRWMELELRQEELEG